MTATPQPASVTPPAGPRLRRSDLALAALVLALAAGSYALARYFSTRGAINLPLSTCDLNQQTCRVDLPDGGSIEVSIEPRPVPTLAPMNVRVQVNGRSLHNVKVNIAGADMEMGRNQAQLQELGNGLFAGPVTLPVCTTRRMLWQATLFLDSEQGVIAAPFRFAVGGRS